MKIRSVVGRRENIAANRTPVAAKRRAADLSALCCASVCRRRIYERCTAGNAFSNAFVLVRHGMWSGSRERAREQRALL